MKGFEVLSGLKQQLEEESNELKIDVPPQEREYGNEEGSKELTYVLNVTESLEQALENKNVMLPEELFVVPEKAEGGMPATLSRKSEVHLTCLGFPHVEILEQAASQYSGGREEFKKKISEILSTVDFSFTSNRENLHLVENLEYDPEAVQTGNSYEAERTIVLDVDTAGIQDFYARMNREFGIDLGPSASHATLYIQDQEDPTTKGLGIAISDIQAQQEASVGTAPHIKVTDLTLDDLAEFAKYPDIVDMPPEKFEALKNSLVAGFASNSFYENYDSMDYGSDDNAYGTAHDKYVEDMISECVDVDGVSELFQKLADRDGNSFEKTVRERGEVFDDKLQKSAINALMDSCVQNSNEHSDASLLKSLNRYYRSLLSEDEFKVFLHSIIDAGGYKKIFSVLNELEKGDQYEALTYVAENGSDDTILESSIVSSRALNLDLVKKLSSFQARVNIYRSGIVPGYEMFGGNLHLVEDDELVKEIARYIVENKGIDTIHFRTTTDLGFTYHATASNDVRHRLKANNDTLKERIGYDQLVLLDQKLSQTRDSDDLDQDDIEFKRRITAEKEHKQQMMREEEAQWAQDENRVSRAVERLSKKKKQALRAYARGETPRLSVAIISALRNTRLIYDAKAVSVLPGEVYHAEYKLTDLGKKVVERI